MASVRVTAPADSLHAGQQLQLSATPLDDAGSALSGRPVTWSSSSDAIATVSASGTVSGVSAGNVTITAASDGRSGTFALRVKPVPVASIVVTPEVVNAHFGTPVQLTAVPRDASGAPLADRPVSWSTSDATRVQVSATGLATPVSTGEAIITATSEGKSATSRVTVLPAPVASVTLAPDSVNLFPGGQQTLTLTARDAAGNALAGRVVTLSTSNSAVATIDANRVVTAVGVGKATITADVEGIVAQTVVVVRPTPVASVALAPDSVDLFPGGQQPLTLTARDAAGNALAGRVATLATSNPAVAVLDTNRVVTAVGEGKATITANVEGVTAQTVVVVRPAPVASVAFSPDSVDLVVGEDAQLALVARDAAGNVLAGRAATIGTDNPAVATIDANRRVTAVGPGRATIVATVEGRTATAVVRVRPVPIATLEITPDSSEIEVGGTVTFAVVARDGAGNAVTRDVTLATSDPSVAAFTSANVVMGMGPGTAVITASAEGKTATAKVVVRQVPVASVEISPAEVIVFAGGTQELAVTARSAGGVALAGRPVQWSTSNPGVATISAAGVVTGVSAGSARITATVEGRTDEVPVTVRIPGQDVTNPEITFFDIDPSAIDVTNGQGTFTVTFRARDYGSGVTGVFVSLNYPGNPGYVPGCPGVRVSGNAYEGTYTCTITFPQNAPAGTWNVDYLSVQDVVGNRVQLSSAEVAARGWPTQVMVTGSAPDTQAPELTGFSFTPQTVNVGSGPAGVVFTFNARDVGTGIYSAYVSLSYPDNPGATMPCRADDPVSGTRNQGVFQCTVTFPHNSAPRTWNVNYVSLADGVNNSVIIYQADLASRGFATQVNVTGGNPDTQAPALTGFSFTPQTVNVSSGPASVVFTISAQDAGGISGVFVSLSFPGNSGPTNPCSASEPVSGTRTNGVWQCTVTFPQNSPSRTWNVDYISLTDAMGNTYRPFQGELQSLGYATTVQVTN